MAMFPEELPRRLIKMFSFVSETVLDPFLGSGTTTKAAKELNRNSVGYEINKSFLPFIKKKIGINNNSLFQEDFFEIIFQNNKKEAKKKFSGELKANEYIIENRINNPDHWKTLKIKN